MFTPTIIEIELKKYRSQRISEENIMSEVLAIFSENEQKRKDILKTLKEPSQNLGNNFNFDLLETDKIYHINDIKRLCIDYRLRFLDSHYFKGEIPEEAISNIRHLEKIHAISLGDFKIVAPAKLLKLENADDPLLFAALGNEYFYLIHKWGKDLHSFRKLMMWPYKNIENLLITVIFISLTITMLSPMSWFSQNAGIAEYIFLLLVVFNSVGGMVIFCGFSLGKNFNEAIWRSKYYNA